jgi:hypothetical protein
MRRNPKKWLIRKMFRDGTDGRNTSEARVHPRSNAMSVTLGGAVNQADETISQP